MQGECVSDKVVSKVRIGSSGNYSGEKHGKDISGERSGMKEGIIREAQMVQSSWKVLFLIRSEARRRH